jgi:uncharacterized protein (TIGR00255 family)
MPQNYREREHDIRKIVIDRAKRGKLDLNIEVKSESGDGEYALNRPLFKKYYRELDELSIEVGMNANDMMQAILRIPNVVSSAADSVEEEEWAAVRDTLNQAMDKFNGFRKTEGAAMEEDCRLRTGSIVELLDQVEPFENQRVERLRKKILKHMDEYVGKDNIDANRFEQEILYYLEKIDITEEKVRLAQHCKYFDEVLDKQDSLKGRKLSFISQEMGREINTLGSKANSSDIQRIVVQMKDELEKIKEQVANSV